MPRQPTNPPPLVLATSSRYRAAMLERLGLAFTLAAPGIDETAGSGERPAELVIRLARAKARAAATDHPDKLVIGADQVAVLGDRVLGKPGERAQAIAQIRTMSGRRVDYLSAIALLGPGTDRSDIVATTLTFRNLADTEIERYVDRDRPFDCAGAMRSESLGITLVDSISSDDPTALIGMPLIRITQWLREAGYSMP